MGTMQDTWMAKTDEVEAKWWVVDASGKTLGRMATQIADVLRGKNKPTFTPHADTGDFVIVINAEKVAMSGAKWDQKVYFRRSRYFGSIKDTKAEKMKEVKPEFVIEEAVRLMLPKNKLSYGLINKLKVYSGPNHDHAAQKPVALTLNS